MASLVEATKHSKKGLVPIVLKLFQKRKRKKRAILPNTFYEAKITMIPKPGKDKKKKKRKENYRPISLINRDEKVPKQNTSKSKTTIHFKNNTSRSIGLHCRGTRTVQHKQSDQRNPPQ